MPESSRPAQVEIEFQPVGRRARGRAGSSLLALAQESGIELIAICGGIGNCAGCKVRVVSGELTPLTLDEESILTAEEIEQGFRLACQTTPLSSGVIDIPPESMSTTQRLQVEGIENPVEIDPPVRLLEVKIDPPSLHDLRADLSRFRDALTTAGVENPRIDWRLANHLSDRLREWKWQGWAVLRGSNVIEFTSNRGSTLGLAVDIGTTKVAAYLVDLESGATLARQGCMNPQIAYGEDVISRIHYCNQNSGGRETLQRAIVGSINKLIDQMCAGLDLQAANIYEAVVVGNTAMHHLFAGLPVRQLGASPYVAAASEALELESENLGLNIHPTGRVYLPPNLAGFVGADHVSMLMAASMDETEQVSLALDIGTNTEISLKAGGKFVSCSCASGPAFEGAHISHGMRAAPGAIERVWIHNGKIRVQTIGGQPAAGICGSGILDAAAELLSAGALDARGNLAASHPLVRQTDGKREVLLTSAEAKSAAVTVSRADINEVQLAKGAIRAGIEVLLAETGLKASELEEFIIAGAFGTYLSVSSAVRVGMFPQLPISRCRQVGNAAGAGARQMLVSMKMREKAAALARKIEYIELTTHPAFSQEFTRGIMFDPTLQESQ